jgi:Peptidase family C25/Propeptide_C25
MIFKASIKAMRLFTLTLMASLVTFSVFAANSVEVSYEKTASNDGLAISVAFPSMQKSSITEGDGKTYSQLNVPGCGLTAQAPGQPEMPFKGLFIEIPHGVQVDLVIESKGSSSLGTGHLIVPGQHPEPDSYDEPQPEFVIDTDAYQTDAFYPSQPVIIDDPAIIRGRRVVFVQVYPMQYNPKTTELRSFNSLRFTLKYTGSIDPIAEARKAQVARCETDLQLGRLILNYEPVETASGKGEMNTNNEATYLIIAADHLYDAIQPLAEWKYRKGYTTRVVKMSEIGISSDHLYQFIKNAYMYWESAPEFVLLVGDAQDVPPGYFAGSSPCVSDIIYSRVDGDDLYADLTIGRIPAHTTPECTIVVDKLLNYEITPATGTWYRNFCNAGYLQENDHDSEADRWFMETSKYVHSFTEGTVGFNCYTAWCSNATTTTLKYRAKNYTHRPAHPTYVESWVTAKFTSKSQATADISSAINTGVCIVQHRDHGSGGGFGDPPFYSSHVRKLTNGYKTPVVFSINCSSGSFFNASDGFCEVFIKKENGGCIGIVGSTRVSWSGPNDLLTHGIYTCFWPQYDPSYASDNNGKYPNSWRPAEALNFGKNYMQQYRNADGVTQASVHMFHYFGDPEMMLRTQEPQILSVAHPATHPIGSAGNLTVTVLVGATRLAGARVAISFPEHPDEYWIVEDTNASGNALFTGLKTTQLGDYDLVVTEANSVPYQGTISSIVTSAGFIAMDSSLYNGESNVNLTLADLDLSGNGTHVVSLNTSSGDNETVTLTETGPATGIFTGSVPCNQVATATPDGLLNLSHDNTITATYMDVGTGGLPTSVVATALADLMPPVLRTVQAENITHSAAQLSFTSDETAAVSVRAGIFRGGPYSIIRQEEGMGLQHITSLSGLQRECEYFFVIDATDEAGNTVTDNNNGQDYSFTTAEDPDYFTEQFSSSDNDLDYTSITFTPDGSSNYYNVCKSTITAFPSGAGGAQLSLENDGDKKITLTSGKTIKLYGTSYSSFYINANGNITFLGGSSDSSESTTDHFAVPRICTLFDSLDPEAGGTITWSQFSNRVVVSFMAVRERSTAKTASFQTVMYFDGTIQMSFLDVMNTDGLTGISAGAGKPVGFVESDLSSYGTCSSDSLWISQGEFLSSGEEAGPFIPYKKTFTLKNTGASFLIWSATCPADWVYFYPNSGTIYPSAEEEVVVILSEKAFSLPMKEYLSSIVFTNQQTSNEQDRLLSLAVEGTASMPFSEDFESGSGLTPCWKVTGTGNYRSQATTENSPYSGTRHLTMDSSSGYARNEMTLAIDLEGCSNVVLSFWARDYGDEGDPPPAGGFTGGADFDGVAVSENGITWYEVLPLRDQLSSTYSQQVVDMDAAIARLGLSYNSRFLIRFNQYDNSSITVDGIAIDDITITGDSAPQWVHPIDINADSDVNQNDLFLLASNWFVQSTTGEISKPIGAHIRAATELFGDFDDNGMINQLDLLFFVENWDTRNESEFANPQ